MATQNKNLQHSNSTMATFLRYPSAWLLLSIAATLTSFVSAWTSSASNRLSRYDCCTHSATTTNTIRFLSSTPDNNDADDDDGNWGFEDNNINDREEEEDPRLTSMRAMLESSWDEKIMGIIPSGPEQAAAAAATITPVWVEPSEILSLIQSNIIYLLVLLTGTLTTIII